MPPLTAKNLPKIRENGRKKEDKSGRKGKNWEVSFTLPLLTDRAGYATALNMYACKLKLPPFSLSPFKFKEYLIAKVF